MRKVSTKYFINTAHIQWENLLSGKLQYSSNEYLQYIQMNIISLNTLKAPIAFQHFSILAFQHFNILGFQKYSCTFFSNKFRLIINENIPLNYSQINIVLMQVNTCTLACIYYKFLYLYCLELVVFKCKSDYYLTYSHSSTPHKVI